MEAVMTLTIPQSLYEQAERIVRTKNQGIPTVLAEALNLVEALALEDQEAQSMAQEEAAYRTLHPTLWANYAGEYVAIYQGKLFDHDRSELALLRRLNAAYPHEVVLMKQVRPLPEPDLHFRSPRFASQR